MISNIRIIYLLKKVSNIENLINIQSLKKFAIYSSFFKKMFIDFRERRERGRRRERNIN